MFTLSKLFTRSRARHVLRRRASDRAVLFCGGDCAMASLKSLMAFDKLEAHMTTVAYIEGFIPTKKDISLFKAISEPGEKYPNASRWYNHIATFNYLTFNYIKLTPFWDHLFVGITAIKG